MPMPALNEAEQKFFSSRGEEVHDSLKPAQPPSVTAAEAKPTEAPSEAPATVASEATQAAEPKFDANPETVPEVKPEPKPDDKKAEERQRLIKEMGLVPLEALQEARSESKQLKEQMRQFQEWQQQLNQQLQQVPREAAETIPDINDDPIAYQQWAIGKLAQQNQQVMQWQAEQSRLQQRDAQIRQLSTWANAQEAEFIKTHPDYPDAWKYAADLRRQEMRSLGITDPQQQNLAIAQDAQMLITQAMQQGKNPAELLWEYAKVRGYKSKGAAATSATQAGTDRTAEALEKIAAGQQASGGLKGGAAPRGKMTPQELASMPIRTPAQKAAFAKAWKEAMA